MNKFLTLLEGGIIGAALLIIFDHVAGKISYRPIYRPIYRPAYKPYYTPWCTKNDDEIIFDTYGDAVSVLEKCCDCINIYGFCSETLLKNYVRDVTGKEVPRKYTDYKLGWKSLKGVEVKRNYKGYYIDFPVSEELD